MNAPSKRQTSGNETTESGHLTEAIPSRSSADAKGRSLRVWPVILLLIALWSLRIVPNLFDEKSMALMMAWFMGPLICVGLILLWWLFFSRASILEKVVGFTGLLAIVFACNAWADKTVKGFGLIIFVIPWGITAFALAMIASRAVAAPRRTLMGLLAAVAVFGFWDLVRTDEIRGDFQTRRSWRWEPTAEERFLEQVAARQPDDEGLPAPEMASPAWPAFRGPYRDGVQPGIALVEDWQADPPHEVWRIKVGPAWSSFAVAGDFLFTQEQRGDEEVVVAYDARNGQEIWVQAYPSRFWEVVGGSGPRATPTLSEDALFALGANGILLRLDPRTGQQAWRRDIREDAGREPPQWGFSSSPLVTHGVVIVHAGGAADKGVLAYDAETGEPRWSVAAGDHSYSSPQLSEVYGEPRVLTLTNHELTIIDPADGRLVGEYVWDYEGYRVVQPLVLDPASVLMGSPMGTGTRRVDLTAEGDEITAVERWTSRRINPYFNDYVPHKGYLYGFDNNIFVCIDLENGERKWKKGRYGNGQVLLLPDHDQLLVISEDGELVLLSAIPEKHVELAKHQVLEGRTWNHPVVVGDRLYVRNAEEAACIKLPIAAASVVNL